MKIAISRCILKKVNKIFRRYSPVIVSDYKHLSKKEKEFCHEAVAFREDVTH